MDLFLIAVTVTCSLLVFFFLRKQFFTDKSQSRIRRVPEAGGAWPIIGHLHFLCGSKTDQLPHRTLGRMADKYGSIFGMKLGVHQVVVVSDPKLAKSASQQTI
ncbi:hypothetical protein H5410_024491 [Solanum commersonii]|uniref:Cytochrome P450 n=1 Tax=Solanum commersonii TaxID=4109 RepID=A0A9J5ZM61_SOLCO|nr:hypothetical protein H5410_024491 [Solanum commersonii]